LYANKQFLTNVVIYFTLCGARYEVSERLLVSVTVTVKWVSGDRRNERLKRGQKAISPYRELMNNLTVDRTW